MIHEAMLYALRYAPVANLEERAILVEYAAEAKPDGCDAAPSHETIAEATFMSVRTVIRRVNDMKARGILRRGNQDVVAYLPKGKRPVVYDIQIPHAWFPDIDLINRGRAQRGQPPLTPEMRPPLSPAPEKKKRADAGKPREKSTDIDTRPVDNQGGLQVTPEGGLQVTGSNHDKPDAEGGLQVTGDYKSQVGVTTSRTTPLGVTEISKVTELLTPNTEQKNENFSNLENQKETEQTEQDVKSPDFWPTLTEWEQSLYDQCIAIDPLWPKPLLRKTIGSNAIRAQTARDPELVQLAFLLAAKSDTTYSPFHLWHIGICEHWRTAQAKLNRARTQADDAVPSVDDQPAPPSAPVQRRPELVPTVDAQASRPPTVGSPAAPNSEYRKTLATISDRRRAEKAAEEAEQERRRARRAELFTQIEPVDVDQAAVAEPQHQAAAS